MRRIWEGEEGEGGKNEEEGGELGELLKSQPDDWLLLDPHCVLSHFLRASQR